MERKTNIYSKDNFGKNINVKLEVGASGSYTSGLLLDANATSKLIDDKIDEVVGGAAEALDTLKELGDAIPTKLSDLTNDVGYITATDGLLQVNQENITVITSLPFPSSWPTNTTLKALCDAVIADNNAKVGNIYLGGVSCSGLPTGMGNGELKIEIINALSGKLLVLTMVSTNLFPYHWERIYYNGSFCGMNQGEWRAYLPISVFDSFVLAIGTEMNGTWTYDSDDNSFTFTQGNSEEVPL